MSFRCNVCKKPQPIGHAPIKIVTKMRDKHYPETSKIGQEIAEEKDCCPACSEVLLMKQRDLRLAAEEAEAKRIEEQAKAIEEQTSNFNNQPRYGERPGEWRDGVHAAE